MDYDSLTIEEAVKKIKSAEIRAEDLVKHHIERAKTMGKELNAFITVIDDALEKARAIDARIAEGEDPGRLAGIPCTVKDVIMTEGIRTTASSQLLTDFVAPYSATAVTRIESEGAIVIGKTNSDPFAYGGSGENSGFGPTLNPLDETRVPGGSSSGAAAAQAAKIGLFGLGTDTGGSVRQPAAFTGVVGFKPTYGRNSRYGLIAMASSFDTVGVFANSVREAALVEEILAGKDEFDATTYEIDVPKYTKSLEIDLSEMKIAFPKQYNSDDMDADVKKKVTEAIDWYASHGATIEEVDVPMIEYGSPIYYVLVPSEISSNMARFDGVRYGHKDNPDYETNVKETRGKYMEDEVKRRVMVGTYALSAGYADEFYKKALKARVKMTEQFEKLFENYDAVIGPTTPSVAFKLGEKINDPVEMYLADIFTVTANLIGAPAISIPCGEVDGLPVGLQLMTKRFNEETLFALAHTYETK